MGDALRVMCIAALNDAQLHLPWGNSDSDHDPEGV